MPDITPTFKDTYLCYQFKLDQEKPIYITEIQPNATKEIAHHILLYGCETPGREEQVWDCGEMNSKLSGRKQFEKGPICKGGTQSIIYAWAMDAPKLILPENVAFKVGGNTNKKYFVMQVHYANIDYFKDGKTDNSGVKLTTQDEPVENVAGVYLLATDGSIKPYKTEHFDAACEVTENVEIIPFAYRTHAHKLGVVNSGYVIKTDPITQEQEWIELGRRSPQLPQMFYPVTNQGIQINKGDVLAARCTMYNFKDHKVSIGPTGEDEMCNFYLMYYGKENKTPIINLCMSWGPPNWYLNDYEGLDVSNMPEDASEVPEDQLKELSNKMDIHMHSSEEKSNENDSIENQIENLEISSESNSGEDELENDLNKLGQKYSVNKLIEKYLKNTHHLHR